MVRFGVSMCTLRNPGSEEQVYMCESCGYLCGNEFHHCRHNTRRSYRMASPLCDNGCLINEGGYISQACAFTDRGMVRVRAGNRATARSAFLNSQIDVDEGRRGHITVLFVTQSRNLCLFWSWKTHSCLCVISWWHMCHCVPGAVWTSHRLREEMLRYESPRAGYICNRGFLSLSGLVIVARGRLPRWQVIDSMWAPTAAPTCKEEYARYPQTQAMVWAKRNQTSQGNETQHARRLGSFIFCRSM